MAIAITDRGVAQTAAGGAITMEVTSAAFSPAAGSLISVKITFDVKNDSGTSDATMVLTDTIGDTGGGTWTQVALGTRGTVALGQYVERAEIWWRVVGTTPGSNKTVKAKASFNGGANLTSTDGWMWAQTEEITGQHATPLGATSGTTGRQAAGPTSLSQTLSGSPAASSLMLGVIHGDNTSTDPTVPSGYTSLGVAHPAWGAVSRAAYRNGGGTSPVVWTGLATGSSFLASAVEVVAAGGAALTQGVTDNIGITDSIALAVGRVVVDAVGITDSMVASLALAQGTVDAIGITDSIEIVLDRVQAITDPVGITDSIETAQTIVVVVVDSIGITDSLATSGGGQLSITDNVGITDSIEISVARALSMVDAIGITDAAAFTIAAAIVDPVGITDSIEVARTIVLVLVDGVGITDSLGLGRSLTITDPIGITDVITTVAGSGPVITGPFTLVWLDPVKGFMFVDEDHSLIFEGGTRTMAWWE